MNLSGDPEIDAVIYLNGDSNANRYAEITIDGAFGGTIIGVSHDRKYLAEVCDTVYVLDEAGLHRRS